MSIPPAPIHLTAIQQAAPAAGATTPATSPSTVPIQRRGIFTGVLLPHQAAAQPWLYAHPRSLLADDVGLGKTVTALALLCELQERGELGRCLLVMPTPLVAQWREQLGTFAPSLTVADSTEKWIRNPGKKDQQAYAAAFPAGHPDVELVTYDLLSRRIADYAARGYRTVVLDEVSSVKGRGVEHEAARRLCETAERVLGMSATPVELDVTETWGILRVLGAPKLLAEAEWGRRYVIWQPAYQPAWGRLIEAKPIGLRAAQLPELRSYLETVVLRRNEAEMPDLPIPVLDERVFWVPLTDVQRHALRVAEGIPDDLRRYRAKEQACGYVSGRSAKAEAATLLLLSSPALSKVVLYAERLDHLGICEQLLDAAGIGWLRVDGKLSKGDREVAQQRFRDDPRIRVLLGSTVLERGLNLQHAGVLISLGSTWNPAREDQRVGRIRRLGSPHQVVTHYMLLTDTDHERGKWAAVARRKVDSQAVLDFAQRT
ncbi:MAG: hypothetical protein JWP11_3228 [Frankiales bacterium]|nr:hypothetical protein [Frankiales bacterium]